MHCSISGACGLYCGSVSSACGLQYKWLDDVGNRAASGVVRGCVCEAECQTQPLVWTLWSQNTGSWLPTHTNWGNLTEKQSS